MDAFPKVPNPISSAITKKATDAFLRTLAEVEKALEIRWNLRSASVQTAARESISKIGTYRLFAEQDREVFVSHAYAEMRVRRERQPLSILDPQDFHDSPIRPQSGPVGISPAEALEREQNGFCLLGTGGGGKSTILRYLSVQAGEGRRFRGHVRIPFFRRAQELAARGETLMDGLTAFFEALDKEYAAATAERALKSGYMMVVVDGLDEVDVQGGQRIVAELSSLSHECSESIFCCSGRPLIQRGTISNFGFWEPMPLSHEEQETFVRKWFAGIEQQKEQALLAEIVEREEFRDLGSNPLLLSLLCANRRYGSGSPDNEAHLLRKVVTGLMGEWDYFRAIQARSDFHGITDPDERALVPGAIANVALEHGCENVFDATVLDNIGVREAIAAVTGWKDAPPTRMVLRSLYTDYGILRMVGADQYCFVHPRVASWCAAFFAWRAGRVDSLPSHLDDPRWTQAVVLGAQLAKPDLRRFTLALQERADLTSTLQVRTLAEIYRSIKRYASAESQDLIAKAVGALESEFRALDRSGASINLHGDVLQLRNASDGRAAHLQALAELGRELPDGLNLITRRAQEPRLKAWASNGMTHLRIVE
jgi:predicted NACHT family NTPase